MSKTLEDLVKGYQRFRTKYFFGNNRAYANLVRFGQQPKVLIVACSDSRVDPAIVFNCSPGDLFVVRNVANLVPPYEEDNAYHGTSAALEFGITGLGIKDVIILGHTQCGGITSLFERHGGTRRGFTAKWMEMAEPAYETVRREHSHATLDESITLCCQHALINSLANLKTFPWIKDRLAEEELALHAWYFDLKTGLIHRYDEKDKEFKIMETPALSAL